MECCRMDGGPSPGYSQILLDSYQKSHLIFYLFKKIIMKRIPKNVLGIRREGGKEGHKINVPFHSF